MAKTGAQRTRANFQRAAKRIDAAAKGMKNSLPSGLRMIGEDVMLDVKASRPGAGVPVDKGPLRASGRVEGPEGGRVTLSFGGAAAGYALIQHEEMSFSHAVGEPRYLIRGIERWRRDGVSGRATRAELQRAIDDVAAGRGGGRLGLASSRAGSFST